jgi:hypothetical protein
MPRNYISLYFKNGDLYHRKKRDVTIGFSADDPLFEKCKNLSSPEIKELISIETYKELKEKARKEDRTINNFIKSKLRIKLLY